MSIIHNIPTYSRLCIISIYPIQLWEFINANSFYFYQNVFIFKVKQYLDVLILVYDLLKNVLQ